MLDQGTDSAVVKSGPPVMSGWSILAACAFVLGLAAVSWHPWQMQACITGQAFDWTGKVVSGEMVDVTPWNAAKCPAVSAQTNATGRFRVCGLCPNQFHAIRVRGASRWEYRLPNLAETGAGGASTDLGQVTVPFAFNASGELAAELRTGAPRFSRHRDGFLDERTGMKWRWGADGARTCPEFIDAYQGRPFGADGFVLPSSTDLETLAPTAPQVNFNALHLNSSVLPALFGVRGAVASLWALDSNGEPAGCRYVELHADGRVRLGAISRARDDGYSARVLLLQRGP